MLSQKSVDEVMPSLRVLLVDDEHYMRKVIRSLLMTIGIKNIFEANDGPRGLEAVRTLTPDIVFLDWNMPGMTGSQFVKVVRSPDTFPYAHVPIVMLTGNSDRSIVVEAVRLGVNEFLLKPVSSEALRARVLSILTNPRKMVRRGDYYGPEPRRMSTYKPENDPGHQNIVLVS
jgi:CheY-like chemotaxis protein